MTLFALLYFLPLLIVLVLAILMPTYDKTATRGDILTGLVISLIPMINIALIIFAICDIFKSDAIQQWLNTPVRKDTQKPAEETSKVDEVA